METEGRRGGRGDWDALDRAGARQVDESRAARLGHRDHGAGDVRAVARVRDLVRRADQGTPLAQGLRELIGEVLALAFRPEDPGRPHGQLRPAPGPRTPTFPPKLPPPA